MLHFSFPSAGQPYSLGLFWASFLTFWRGPLLPGYVFTCFNGSTSSTFLRGSYILSSPKSTDPPKRGRYSHSSRAFESPQTVTTALRSTNVLHYLRCLNTNSALQQVFSGQILAVLIAFTAWSLNHHLGYSTEIKAISLTKQTRRRSKA